jgi:hypothetical protein
MSDGMYRFVVCIDLEAESLSEAYALLYQKMASTFIDWETTDEAYNPDGSGISGADLSQVRMEHHPPCDWPPHDAATATGMYDRDDG